MMVCRARHETNAETGLHGSRTSYTEYAFDRNALLLRACACVLRLTRVWRLITDIRYLYTIGAQSYALLGQRRGASPPAPLKRKQHLLFVMTLSVLVNKNAPLRDGGAY